MIAASMNPVPGSYVVVVQTGNFPNQTAVLDLTIGAVGPAGPTGSAGEGGVIFDYTGAEQVWTVPANVTKILVEAWAAGGGGGGGGGKGNSNGAGGSGLLWIMF
jgi:hypothetical protein